MKAENQENTTATEKSRTRAAEEPRVLFVLTTRHVGVGAFLAVVFYLSFFVLHTYRQVYDPQYGWTKLTLYGMEFAKNSLPRLQHVPHYITSSPGDRFGYDGQFYGQMAIDPSLRDPAFPLALDHPAYRGRRIGLPAISFCLAWGKPRRIVQIYALSNLLFWFVLLAALVVLMRPWTGQPLLCLSASMLSLGVIISMERALIDLPAAAMIFVGAAIGSWGGYAALAVAGLTRETSLLAAAGFLNPWRPGARGWQEADWKRSLCMFGVAVVPLVVWMIYLRHRFGADQTTTGYGNFSFPLQALVTRLVGGIRQAASYDHGPTVKQLQWLYLDNDIHELLAMTGLFFQGVYLILRRDVCSPFWRTGICYVALGALLGDAVWEEAAAAARVLLPMTICFYLLVARERAGWFWPFFILGSLSVPWSVYDFWTLT